MSIFKWFEQAHTHYIIQKNPLPKKQWLDITARLAILSHLDKKQLKTLKKLTILFLHEKTIVGVKGLEINDEMKITIAAQACLPILNLGLDYYDDGWVEVVVYPDTFIASHQQTDALGVISQSDSSLSGEAWMRGPVILSWHDVLKNSYQLIAGHNIIIHEFSHKLDMLNGRANGMPPLHPSMHREEWTLSLSQAYKHLSNQVDHHRPSYINQYAATDPAEFFAVISEYFFTTPAILIKHCPDVYEQLALFYNHPKKQTS